MTVSQLIEKLKEMPQEAEVKIKYDEVFNDGGGHLDSSEEYDEDVEVKLTRDHNPFQRRFVSVGRKD